MRWPTVVMTFAVCALWYIRQYSILVTTMSTSFSESCFSTLMSSNSIQTKDSFAVPCVCVRRNDRVAPSRHSFWTWIYCRCLSEVLCL